MLKQSDIFNGSELSAVEKYELEKTRNEDVIAYINEEFGLDIPVSSKTRKNNRKRYPVSVDCYTRIGGMPCVIKEVFKDMVLVASLTGYTRIASLEEVKEVQKDYFELLKEDDEIVARLENNIPRLFKVIRLEYINKRPNVLCYDVEDGEVFVFEKKDVEKIKWGWKK